MRNRNFSLVLVLLIVFQMSFAAPASAFKLGKVLDEVTGALDRVSASLDRTFGGTTEENQQVIDRSREQAPQTSAFIGRMEESWEVSMGDKVHQSMRKDPGFVRDSRYVNRLGTVARRLINHVERKDLTWRFAVLDQKEVNAFAAPGGYIYVTRGLMDLVENEDELAAVVAHEMGHIDKKHSVRQAEKNGGMAVLVAGMGLWDKTKKYAPAAAIAAYFAGLKFSRVDEFEADACAIKYTQAAGYDPNGLVGFFDKINNDTKASKYSKYFSTHPPTNDRIKKAKEQIARLPSRAQPVAQIPVQTRPANQQPPQTQRPQQTTRPTNQQLQAAYEEYQYYQQLYQYKVQQQAPMNEIMETMRKYHAARDRYVAMRRAAGL